MKKLEYKLSKFISDTFFVNYKDNFFVERENLLEKHKNVW